MRVHTSYGVRHYAWHCTDVSLQLLPNIPQSCCTTKIVFRQAAGRTCSCVTQQRKDVLQRVRWLVVGRRMSWMISDWQEIKLTHWLAKLLTNIAINYTTVYNTNDFYVASNVATCFGSVNPLKPELNTSAHRCLTRFLLRIFLLEPCISLTYAWKTNKCNKYPFTVLIIYMVAPTCFGFTLSSSGSVYSALWEMLNWGVADRILWMGVLCLVTILFRNLRWDIW
jgi:hypothetical protein